MTILLFIGGLIGLVLGAELLVRGASKLALSFGISPLVVGLTIVAFGTSAPEMAVSTGAVLNGQTDIAIGNVVGSNIFNVLFVLGVSALITPLVVNIQLIRQEVPIMIGASLLLLVIGLDGKLGFLDGAILFTLLIAYTVFLIVQSRAETRSAQDEYAAELQPAAPGGWDAKLPVQLLLIAVGLGFLVLGSDWLVTASTLFAKALGVSDLVIGLTIVAAGTSMPEVATSVMAAIKGERDIAVGNVVGSSTFNILGCLGLSGLVSGDLGLLMPAAILNFDIWVMIAVALACLPVFMTGREIARWEGGVFVLYYAAYVTYLILATQQHDALGMFSSAMLSFVIPITVITLVVVLLRRGKPPGRAS
ncbi:calcium/sodium antiporter [Polaromonas sp.]|uniref:calcium/sodium antiporter n=1 Tax=Polaromonas sp. TaxID=1869339 RepID=UPI001DBDC7FF|nr:calcium/sodium antiporter [Polaromonas sp.]MBT9476674.1 calcium/sodium antiporter [Polaromonas sp.]